MKKSFTLIATGLTLIAVTILSGCGDSGSVARANTVYLTASGKDGSTFSIYTDLVNLTNVPPIYNSGSFDYTINSTVYAGSTGIVASSVIITEAQISFVPLVATDGSMSPALSSWTKYPSGNLPAGGTLDLTMAVVDDLIMTEFDNRAPANVTPNVQYRYKVLVVFKGTEVTTGKAITCSAVETNFYVTRNGTLIVP